MSDKKSAVLVLEDGTRFKGFSFGADLSSSGQVVLNTAMTGYPELLSDPLMRGHIVVMTYPLVGNYGVPPRTVEGGLLVNFESDTLQAAGLVVTDYSEEFSHWNAAGSLADRLKESGVPAVSGIDTRALAKHIREHGEMTGKILVEGIPAPKDVDLAGLIEEVSTPKPVVYGEGDVTIALLDTGVQNTVIESLVRRGVKVLRLPWNTDLAGVEYDGLVLVGTIDDPSPIAENVRRALDKGKPIFGVCGADLTLALAAGGRIVNLGHGHRGANQPVLEFGTDHAYITTQNHSWAVDAASLPADWSVWFTNLNDGSVEGIKHKTKPFRAVQFHPEPTSNPVEADKLYDNFTDSVRTHKHGKTK